MAKSAGTHGRDKSINKQGISQHINSQDDQDDDDESNHTSSASSTLKGIAEVASR